jgi:hypothetical protein
MPGSPCACVGNAHGAPARRGPSGDHERVDGCRGND